MHSGGSDALTYGGYHGSMWHCTRSAQPNLTPPPCSTLQLQHTRKEWDLNRPDHKQIDSAARVGDNDPRIGAASMQKFEGEDLSVSATALATWDPHALDFVMHCVL